MTELRLRTFEVHYESLSMTSDSLKLERKDVDAAYFQQGFAASSTGTDGDGFVVFKDCQHKPVFTVRASSVVTIEEIRDRDQGSKTLIPGQYYEVPLTPEMQARMAACSGAVTPSGYTTAFTMSGPSIPQQATHGE